MYDVEGRRVQKTSAPGTADYLYDFAGYQVAEISSSGVWKRGEVYAGNRHIATYSANTTYFIHLDWLGTERARSNVSGGLCETTTSLPFGDWQSNSGSCSDASPMHFTGKQHDTESNLDYFGARYNSSSFGRFMSPDEPFYNGDLKNPQSLNLYAYVQNNPLKNIDPDGHDVRVCVEGADKCVNYTDQQYDALLAAQNGKQGIDLPSGDKPTGDITCGGRTCGTAEYFEPGLDPSDNFTAVGAIAGAQGAGAIVGWIRTGAEFLNGLFGSRAAAIPGTGGGKVTFKDLLQGTVKDAGGQSTKNGGFAQATKDFESLEGKSQDLGGVGAGVGAPRRRGSESIT